MNKSKSVRKQQLHNEGFTVTAKEIVTIVFVAFLMLGLAHMLFSALALGIERSVR